MNKVTIAFDVDGTLIRNGAADEHQIRANERIRGLLIALAHSKNVKIVVWSGGGELWARQAAAAIGVDTYVDEYASKNLIGKDEHGKYIFDPDLQPDIAIDDIQDCVLGKINIIVREK
jgi:phosphoserine phosphatase